MEIALIADDEKKELMAQFCIAYCGVLAKNRLCSTGTTAKYIKEATGLEIESMLDGIHGGVQQIASRVSYDEIDLLIYFRNAPRNSTRLSDEELLSLCDLHMVPTATNIATAEALIFSLENGGLDWRKNVNPHSMTSKKEGKK